MTTNTPSRRQPTSLLLPAELEGQIVSLIATIAARTGIAPSRSQVLRYLLSEGCTAARAKLDDLQGMH